MILKIISFYIFIICIATSSFAQSKTGTFKVKKRNQIIIAEDSIIEVFPAYRQYSQMVIDSCPCGGDVNPRLIDMATKLSTLVKNCDWYNDNIVFTSYGVYLSTKGNAIQSSKAHGDDFPRAVRMLLINTRGRKVTFSYIRAYNKQTGKALKLPTVTFNALHNN